MPKRRSFVWGLYKDPPTFPLVRKSLLPPPQTLFFNLSPSTLTLLTSIHHSTSTFSIFTIQTSFKHQNHPQDKVILGFLSPHSILGFTWGNFSNSSIMEEEPHLVYDFQEQPEYQQRQAVVSLRKQTPCQYFCKNTLKELGLYREVKEYVRIMGLEKLTKIRAHSYRELTEEVLSSFELYTTNNGKPIKITFRLFDAPQEVSYDAILDVFGFNREGIALVGEEFDRGQAWRELSYDTRPFASGKAKARQLKSFAHRYINRWLNCTIFGTSDHGRVRVDTLASFYYAQRGQAFNFGRSFCHHLHSVAFGDSNSLIGIGGMITHLVVKLFKCSPRVFGDFYRKVDGIERVDMRVLSQMQMLRIEGDNKYLVSARERFLVPPRHGPGEEEAEEARDENLGEPIQEENVGEPMQEDAPHHFEAGPSTSAPPPPPPQAQDEYMTIFMHYLNQIQDNQVAIMATQARHDAVHNTILANQQRHEGLLQDNRNTILQVQEDLRTQRDEINELRQRFHDFFPHQP